MAQDVTVAEGVSATRSGGPWPSVSLLPGGGSSDDVPIQAAINALSTAGGGTVYLGSGTFTLNNPVALKSGVSVIGVPATLVGSVFIDGQWVPSSNTILLNGTAGNGMVYNSTNLGAIPSPWATTALNNVALTGITFSGFVNGLIIGAQNNPGCNYCKLEDLNFYNCSGWGSQLRNFGGSTFKRMRAIKCVTGGLLWQMSANNSGQTQIGNSTIEQIHVDESNLTGTQGNFAQGVVIGCDPAFALAANPVQMNEMQVSGVEVFSFGAGRQVGGITDTATYTQTAITFTVAPVVTSTSATLNANWGGTTGVYTIKFSTNETRWVTLTNGSTACNWSVAGVGQSTGQGGLYNGGATTAATACKIAVVTGTNFPSGMPFAFTTSDNSYVANRAYFIVAQNGNTICVGNQRAAGYANYNGGSVNFQATTFPIACQAAGSSTITQSGYPLLDLGGIYQSQSIACSTFEKLDLEGLSIGGLYAENCTATTIHVSQGFTQLATFGNFVARSCYLNTNLSMHGFVKPDFDPISSSMLWLGQRPSPIQNPGNWGLFFDSTLQANSLILSQALNGAVPDLFGDQNGLVRAKVAIGQAMNAFTTTTTFPFWNSAIVSVEPSAAAQVFTLPQLIASSNLILSTEGISCVLLNPGNQSTPQTCTVIKNTTAGTGQSIVSNGVNFSTITLTSGATCTLRACQNAAKTLSWWQVTAFTNATFS